MGVELIVAGGSVSLFSCELSIDLVCFPKNRPFGFLGFGFVGASDLFRFRGAAALGFSDGWRFTLRRLGFAPAIFSGDDWIGGRFRDFGCGLIVIAIVVFLGELNVGAEVWPEEGI
jgi:hypothetical protein